MYHVLVPVDTDPNRALTQAACLLDFPAASEELRVTVTHARPATGGKRRPIKEIDAVDRAVRVFERADIPVEAIGCETPIDRGIVSIADDCNVDQIVMDSHNRSIIEEIVFGSVTNAVRRHTALPVTVTGPGVDHDRG
jgi:nucleotide-binding universal stress UspA family protein